MCLCASSLGASSAGEGQILDPGPKKSGEARGEGRGQGEEAAEGVEEEARHPLVGRSTPRH